MRKGSTLVEAAVVLLLFLTLLIGIMDFGQVLFFHHFLNERVRSGARYAAVHAFESAKIRNFVACNDAAAAPGTPGLFGLAPEMVEVRRYGAGTAADRVEVEISSFGMRFLTPWLARPFTPGPFRAVMPVESGGGAE